MACVYSAFVSKLRSLQEEEKRLVFFKTRTEQTRWGTLTSEVTFAPEQEREFRFHFQECTLTGSHARQRQIESFPAKWRVAFSFNLLARSLADPQVTSGGFEATDCATCVPAAFVQTIVWHLQSSICHFSKPQARQSWPDQQFLSRLASLYFWDWENWSLKNSRG